MNEDGAFFQRVGDDDLNKIEEWCMTKTKVVTPKDAYDLRNMLAHMVREVRAARQIAEKLEGYFWHEAELPGWIQVADTPEEAATRYEPHKIIPLYSKEIK